jgi:hypothetical protein
MLCEIFSSILSLGTTSDKTGLGGKGGICHGFVVIDTSRYVYEFGISTKYSLEKCREQLIIAHGINHLVSTQQNNHRSCRSMQNPKPLPLTNMYI